MERGIVEMGHVLDLFQDLINECTSVQEEIHKLNSLESDLKTKKLVLQSAANLSSNQSDIEYFHSEIQKVYIEQQRVTKEKAQQQMRYRDLVRRVNVIETVAKQFEQKE